MESAPSGKRQRDIFPQGGSDSLTQTVVSALVVLEVAHGQSVRRDLLAALGQRLDDVEPRPRTELLILSIKPQTMSKNISFPKFVILGHDPPDLKG